MADRTWDAGVRNAAFEWLQSQVDSHGDVLPRALLAEGFTLHGHRVPLVGPQGIFKPRVLPDAPLSITTAPSGPEGEPTVANGLALCKLHHAAFDRYFLGVRPDYVVQVRPDLLRETDGPTLVHGIQALHGSRITVPRKPGFQPDRHFLEIRYENFRRA